jgi:hypothetical protein
MDRQNVNRRAWERGTSIRGNKGGENRKQIFHRVYWKGEKYRKSTGSNEHKQKEHGKGRTCIKRSTGRGDLEPGSVGWENMDQEKQRKIKQGSGEQGKENMDNG